MSASWNQLGALVLASFRPKERGVEREEAEWKASARKRKRLRIAYDPDVDILVVDLGDLTTRVGAKVGKTWSTSLAAVNEYMNARSVRGRRARASLSQEAASTAPAETPKA